MLDVSMGCWEKGKLKPKGGNRWKTQRQGALLKTRPLMISSYVKSNVLNHVSFLLLSCKCQKTLLCTIKSKGSVECTILVLAPHWKHWDGLCAIVINTHDWLQYGFPGLGLETRRNRTHDSCASRHVRKNDTLNATLILEYEEDTALE